VNARDSAVRHTFGIVPRDGGMMRYVGGETKQQYVPRGVASGGAMYHIGGATHELSGNVNVVFKHYRDPIIGGAPCVHVRGGRAAVPWPVSHQIWCKNVSFRRQQIFGSDTWNKCQIWYGLLQLYEPIKVQADAHHIADLDHVHHFRSPAIHSSHKHCIFSTDVPRLT
jgi:hypothetical protein